MGKINKAYRFEPDFVVPPGATLRETMQSLGMSQKELAARTGLTIQTLSRMFSGEQVISYETANKLELVTGVPSRFWNNLEAQYREQITKMRETQRLETYLGWLTAIPTNELIARGYMGRHKEKAELLRDTLKFYGVSSVAAWREIWETPMVAARRSQCFETRPGAASAWIRMGELKAQKIKCEPYDRPLFIKALGTIRSLTVKEPEVFAPEMKRLCAQAGVAVSLVREMKKVPWNGATKWIGAHKAMILLNLRGKGEDRFWLSFFHEAGHVLHDKKKDLLINDGSHDDWREVRADGFAGEFLVPRKYDSSIAAIRTKAEVRHIAADLGVSPGIIVGRYQHITKKWNFFHDQVRKFQWT